MLTYNAKRQFKLILKEPNQCKDDKKTYKRFFLSFLLSCFLWKCVTLWKLNELRSSLSYSISLEVYYKHTMLSVSMLADSLREFQSFSCNL